MTGVEAQAALTSPAHSQILLVKVPKKLDVYGWD